MRGLVATFLSKTRLKVNIKKQVSVRRKTNSFCYDAKTNFTKLDTFVTFNDKTYRCHFEKGGTDMVAYSLWIASDSFSPKGYGGYYAWGETKEKDYYYWETYTHCDVSSSTSLLFCHFSWIIRGV